MQDTIISIKFSHNMQQFAKNKQITNTSYKINAILKYFLIENLQLLIKTVAY